MMIALLLCVFFGSLKAGESQLIQLEYTAENTLTNDGRTFTAKLLLETNPKPFIEIMQDAARIDPRFSFETDEHNEFGHFVIAINGVYESVEEQQYWAFMKIENGIRCHMSTGISSYVPLEGEHMLFSFVPWSYEAPSC